jgi:hypothetical protein
VKVSGVVEPMDSAYEYLAQPSNKPFKALALGGGGFFITFFNNNRTREVEGLTLSDGYKLSVSKCVDFVFSA